jgi:hypothetical protein
MWHTWVVRLELTQFDADAYALARTVEVLASSYTGEVAPPDTIYLLNTSSSAFLVVMNPQSIKAHSYTLCFHRVLTGFFLTHRDIQLILCCTPRDDKLEGSQMASNLAATAC